MDSRDDFARDRHGRIIKDHYGRPVRRRTTSAGHDSPSSPRRPLPGTSDNNHAIPPLERRPITPESGTPSRSSDPRNSNQSVSRRPAPAEPVRARPLESTYSPDYNPEQQQPHYRRTQQQPSQPHPQRMQWQQLQQAPPQPQPHYRRPQQPHIQQQRSRRRRRLPRLRVGRLIGVILVGLLALTVGMGLWVDTNLQRTDAIKNYDGRPSRSLSGTNWLLVGSDSRAGLTTEDADRLMAGELDNTINHTDTIMVVHVPLAGKATMLSIPRDSYVDIPGYGYNKINQAFALGGAPLLQQTIEQSTGIRVDRYAEIGFGGFANVVDKMGGVNICVEEPLDDPMAGINLQAGCQDMDGPTALGFVRSRYASANGDLDRVARQRQFLNAMATKMSSGKTLANPFRLFPTVDALSGSLTVNNKDHVWNLGKLALGMAGGVDQETVPVAGYEDTEVGNVVLWDEGAAQQLFDTFK